MPKRKVIGLLGLSADPPHCGHLEIAKLLLKNRSADEIWLILCRKHSFGKLMAPLEHRWRMVKLLEESGIKVDDAEIRRRGISYAIDTVEILQKKYPAYRFYWVVGSDIVKSGSYKKWRDWKKLASLVDFLVVVRSGFEIKKMPVGFTLIEGRISDISSMEIRERVKCGLPIDDSVPQKIKEYIKKHNLYK